MRLLTALAEFRGKQTLWTQTKPEVLKQLLKIAVIESVESSSRMEQVEVGPQTFDRIVRKSGDPEAENPLTGPAMSALHEGLATALGAGEIEPLLLVPLYAHDLLCIHPFLDGNGRIARLMTVLLLHRLGYEVGRYVSIERIIEGSKATYYDSLAASDLRWNEGRHDHVPFAEYLLGAVLAAYRELEESTNVDLDHGARGRMVERAIQSLPTEFRLEDVEERCPLVSRDTIRSAMAKLQREGMIVCVRRGRGALWHRLR